MHEAVDTTFGRRVARGAAAGLAATMLLSLLARVPLIRRALDPVRRPSQPPPPNDPFNRAQVRAWQEASWSPGARAPVPQSIEPHRLEGIGPATALRQPQSPGPEGLAEQFAFKVASGLFERDIAASLRTYGRIVHFVYGTSWGVVYQTLMSARAARHPIAGASYGLAVYVIGPALLLPAMRIMGPVRDERPFRTMLLVAAHVIYGVALSRSFHIPATIKHAKPLAA